MCVYELTHFLCPFNKVSYNSYRPPGFHLFDQIENKNRVLLQGQRNMRGMTTGTCCVFCAIE